MDPNVKEKFQEIAKDFMTMVLFLTIDSPKENRISEIDKALDAIRGDILESLVILEKDGVLK